MKHLSLIQTAACAALLFAALAPRAVRADAWNQRTVLTFSDTVQVPGATLPAGTYVFRLRDSQSDRYTVQILNERENHTYATVLAIPDYRDTAPEKTMVSFSMRRAPAGQPDARKGVVLSRREVWQGVRVQETRGGVDRCGREGNRSIRRKRCLGPGCGAHDGANCSRATCPCRRNSGRDHDSGDRTAAGAGYAH